MQSPYVPETPGRSPVIPEEKPSSPRPELPVPDPAQPEERRNPEPDEEGDRLAAMPEALDIRIP